MKRFLNQILLFSILLIIPIVLVFYIADGSTDSYYLKFTTPKQQFLILGSSRAAQGIVPSVMNPILRQVNSSTNFFNYSFTINHSPYGPTYYKSIQKKINQETKDGIFILAVDPWSISSGTNPPDDSTKFGELDLFVAKTKFVNLKPNFFYLLESYDKAYIDILKKRLWKIIDDKSKPSTYLHEDGWLEVNTKMDSLSVRKRVEERIKSYYKNYLPVYKYSEVRYDYLKKTIEFLKKHGKVYLVRLPIEKATLQIENQFMPDFNNKIQQITGETNTAFMNFTDSSKTYLYVDENHLYKTSGIEVSKDIANWIVNNQR